MIFANIFFLQKIFNQLKKKFKFHFLFIFSSFIITNTAFYRLAEHGTDRSALILVFILAIYYLDSLNKNLIIKKSFFNFYKNNHCHSFNSFIEEFLPYLLRFIISLIFEFRKYILIQTKLKNYYLIDTHTILFLLL